MQIKAEMDAVYRCFLPAFAIVKFSGAELKRSHTNLVNDERSGWQKTATISGSVRKDHQTVLD